MRLGNAVHLHVAHRFIVAHGLVGIHVNIEHYFHGRLIAIHVGAIERCRRIANIERDRIEHVIRVRAVVVEVERVHRKPRVARPAAHRTRRERNIVAYVLILRRLPLVVTHNGKRNIARNRRVIRNVTDALNAEQLFDDERTAEQPRQDPRQHGDERDRRVFERVLVDDVAPFYALRLCRTDIIGVEHFEHVRACVAHQSAQA